MKLYKITNAFGEFTHKDIVVCGAGECVWAGTQADARKARIAFEAAYKELPSTKRPRIEVEEVEVPTDKQGLLAWLNAA